MNAALQPVCIRGGARMRLTARQHPDETLALELNSAAATVPRMKFVMATLIWLVVGFVLGLGLYKVAYGASLAFFLVPALLISIWVGKVGYKTH